MKTPILFFAGFIWLVISGCCNGEFIIPSEEEEEITDVAALMENCSADHGFTTVNGVATATAGSCADGPSLSAAAKRFSFIAPPSGESTIIIQTGTEYGTQKNTNVVLFDTNGTTELDCETWSVFQNEFATIYLYYGDLTPGETYYFNVGVANLASAGTFKLCLTDSD